MSKIYLPVLLILWILGAPSVAPELMTCYTCGPSDKGECLVFEKYKENVIICQNYPVLGREKRGIVKSPYFECFTIIVTGSTSEQTGVHRGCLEKDSGTLSSCELLSEMFKNENITMCQTCTENNCNIHDVNEVNYSPASQTISLILVFLNFIIFFVF